MKNNDPIFWPASDIDLDMRQKRNQNYNDSLSILQTQWLQADIDQRFAMGDGDIWGQLFPTGPNSSRKIFNFNLCNATLQMIGGYQRRNRKSSICIPVISPVQKTADQLTKCLYYIHNRGGVYQTYSDAFELGALTQGLGFVSIYQDMTDDPVSGDIKARYIDMKSCLFDPYFRKHDLSDCRFFWTRQFFDQEEAAILYPEFSEEIRSLPRGNYKDDKFYFMPEVYQIQFPNIIAFDEYWYLSTRQATFLIDTESQECIEFDGDEEDIRIVLQQNRNLKVVHKPKPTTRRSIIVNDRVLIDEANPYGIDRYPFVPFLGYFTADTPYYAYKFRGVIRDMRDAQYLFNRRKVADLDILESQQQGLKVRQGALVTPEDGLNSGNGRMLIVAKNANMEDVQKMDINPPSPVMLQMEEMLQQVLSRISGVNETLLGTDINDKAGVISMMRQSAGITTLTRLFDQFDEAQRLCGDIMVEMVQKKWSYGKVRQVCGEEPTPEFRSKAFFKYGCKIVQATLTEDQKQLELAQLLQLHEILGDVVPPESILDAMTIQNKNELKERIQKNQQAIQQQQQKMAELQMQQLQVDNETKLAYAESQKGLAAERIAKIDFDKAVAIQKLESAKTEDMNAILNLVKALKEAKGMDLDHIQRQVEILNGIKNLSSEDLQQQTAQGGLL